MKGLHRPLDLIRVRFVHCTFELLQDHKSEMILRSNDRSQTRLPFTSLKDFQFINALLGHYQDTTAYESQACCCYREYSRPPTVAYGPPSATCEIQPCEQRTSCIADAAARPIPVVLYLGNSRILKEIPKPAAKIRTGKGLALPWEAGLRTSPRRRATYKRKPALLGSKD
jgi:hypothetical protein